MGVRGHRPKLMSKRHQMKQSQPRAARKLNQNKRPRDKSEADTGKPPKKKKAEGNIIRIEGHDTSTQSSATTAQSLGGTAAQSSTTTFQSSGGTASESSTTTSQSSGGTASESSTTTSQSSGGTAAQSSTTTSQSSGGTAAQSSTTTSQSSGGTAAQSSTTTFQSSGGTATKSSASTIRSPEVPLSTDEGTLAQSSVVIATQPSGELLTRSSEEEKGLGPEASRELCQP